MDKTELLINYGARLSDLRKLKLQLGMAALIIDLANGFKEDSDYLKSWIPGIQTRIDLLVFTIATIMETI